MLEDDLTELNVGRGLCALTQRQHLFFEATTQLKELFDVLCALLFCLILELLALCLRGITLLICIKVQVVADLLTEGCDAATWAEAAQNLENVAVRHSCAMILYEIICYNYRIPISKLFPRI